MILAVCPVLVSYKLAVYKKMCISKNISTKATQKRIKSHEKNMPYERALFFHNDEHFQKTIGQ